jgi:cytochrome P450
MLTVSEEHFATRRDAEQQAREISLANIDVAQPRLFAADAVWPYFRRLRRDAPVHFCRESQYGPYWSITRFKDILAVESDSESFSSDFANGGITINDSRRSLKLPMFIAMDPPRHTRFRRPVEAVITSEFVDMIERRLRVGAATLLDGLPRNETFDWVERVSIDLSTQMLAILLDYPWEERRRLAYWADVVSSLVDGESEMRDDNEREMLACLGAFTSIWNERANSDPTNDFISALAHSEFTQRMNSLELLSNIILLIVGGSDTSRNSSTGSLFALMSAFPDQFRKLKARPALLPNLVSEIFRWQAPLAHMRRTATRDVALAGKTIKAGEKVVLWYASANRDEAVVDDGDNFIIDSAAPRRHIAFGFGIHRCIGRRLATLQQRILWEEILKRFDRVEVVEPPERRPSVFVRGYRRLSVRIPA